MIGDVTTAARRTFGRRGSALQGLGRSQRRDRWRVEPAIVVLVLGSFIVYSLFSALLWGPLFGVPYEVAGYLSPFFSPLIAPDWLPTWFSPAILILWIPLGFRTTCYYYRKAYYRSIFLDPPACAVGEVSTRYHGENRFPFLLQNLHRFFLYPALIPIFFLSFDALLSFGHEGHLRLGLGTAVLGVNALLLTAYTFSCHSARHLIGGRLDCFSCDRMSQRRGRLWGLASRLNMNHARWAWFSLFSVVLADLYVRLLAAGVFSDPHILL